MSIGQSISLESSKIKHVPTLSDSEAKSFEDKGWTLPQVWDLLFLKQVFIGISFSNTKTKKELYNIFINAKPRYVDEYCNALVCFGLIENNNQTFEVLCPDFFDVHSVELTDGDKVKLETIFFSYFRFREIANWFFETNFVNKIRLNELGKTEVITHSQVLFGSAMLVLRDKRSNKKRMLTDTFFHRIPPVDLKQLTVKENKMMRFFDVYINWGMSLNKIETINLTDGINVFFESNRDRKIKAYYFINDDQKINVRHFIEQNYDSGARAISIPELTINMALQFRCSLPKIHEAIIEQTSGSDGLYSLQRTSKSFISKDRNSRAFERDREKLYAKLGNTFISHLIIR